MQERKQTIVLFSPSYHPVVGGAEKQAKGLAEHWAAAGKKVCVITRRPAGAPPRETINGVDVRRLDVSTEPIIGSLSFLFKIFSALRPLRHETQAVLSQMFNTDTLMLSIAAHWLKIPLIVRPSAGGPDGNLDKMKRTLFGGKKARALLRRTAILVAINTQIADEFSETGLADVHSIPNGVDTEIFHPASAKERAAARHQHNVPGEAPVVLFVGRLDPVKNLEFFLSLWPAIVKKNSHALFLIAGDGPSKRSLQQKSQNLGVSANVRFLGNVSAPKSLYHAADVLVLPSTREGLSNTLLEALASGMAAIVSDIKGNQAAVEANQNGLLISPHDSAGWTQKLLELLKDSSRRKELGEAARARIVSDFSIDTVADAYVSLADALTHPAYGQALPILAYHRTQDAPRYGIDIATPEFERQIKWLADNGYASISLNEFFSDLHEKKPLPSKKVAITFDDGHKDTHQTAFPILKKHGFTATVFLNSGLLGKTYWVGGRKPAPTTWHDKMPNSFDEKSRDWRVYDFMSWDNAKELKEAGWEIGSHGVTHPFLTQLNDADLKSELEKSRKEIEAKLGVRPDFFCYPSGDNDGRVRKAVKAAGYRGAVVSKSHYQMFFTWENPYAIERVGLWQDVSFWKFKALVEGWYPRLHRRMPTVFWKFGRTIARCFVRHPRTS